MKITPHGRVSWTLKDGKWVRPETGEADSRQFGGVRECCDAGTVRTGTGARPKRGEKPYKPSEDLLRSLNRTQQNAERDVQAERFAALEQRLRDIESGKVVVDPDATLATPVVRVEDGDRTHYVRADHATDDVKAKSERQRASREEDARKKHAVDVAKKMRERGQIAGSLAAVGKPLPPPGVFLTEDPTAMQNVMPAMPDASTRGVDPVQFQTWTPTRNEGRRFF
jgi:hypothetical protein